MTQKTLPEAIAEVERIGNNVKRIFRDLMHDMMYLHHIGRTQGDVFTRASVRFDKKAKKLSKRI